MDSPALPTEPYTGAVDADIADDAGFRRLQAEHLAALTLSAQRTEWYLRSIRLTLMIWFALFVVASIIGLVMGIVAVTSGPEPEPIGF